MTLEQQKSELESEIPCPQIDCEVVNDIVINDDDDKEEEKEEGDP